MTTRTATTPAKMPTVTISGREIRIHRDGYGYRTVGYVDLVDAHTSAAEIRGAIADAYVAGQQHARTEVAHIVEACTDDDSVNGADLVGGNDRTDGLMEWLAR
jgi:hypothetical protein